MDGVDILGEANFSIVIMQTEQFHGEKEKKEKEEKQPFLYVQAVDI
jgi:hypothetical protein